MKLIKARKNGGEKIKNKKNVTQFVQFRFKNIPVEREEISVGKRGEGK